MSRHGFAPTLRRIPLVAKLLPAGEDPESNVPAPERFCSMLEELGPTFVKVGQILSTRSDLLPPAFTAQLSKLQDQVPPFPFAEAKAQVEREFGRPLDELYDHFEERPLASASMAQVHRARLKGSDDEVVVKIQRPGIAEQVAADASILVLLAQLLELIVEEASHHHAVDLAEEFEDGLRNELDFSLEAKNLKAFAAFNRHRAGVHVPDLVEDLSGRTVLTMEFVRGRRITELLNEGDTERTHTIVERLVKTAYEHFFVDGMFHGDPHPGNLLVTESGDIAFIDFGLMGRVARGTQDRMLLVLLALSLRDADTLSRLLVRVGEVSDRIVLSEFRDAIAKLLDRYLGLSVGEVNSSEALTELLDLSARFGVRMPREFALLSKASVAIEGVVRTLHPGLNPSRWMAERTEALLVERLDPRNLKGGGLRTALQLGVVMQELPLQLSQTLLDLERGNLTVRMEADALERLERDMRGLGMTVFGGLLASALTLSGFYGLLRYDWRVLGVPVLPALAFLGAGVMFGVAFTWFLTGGQLPKLSATAIVGRLLGRRR